MCWVPSVKHTDPPMPGANLPGSTGMRKARKYQGRVRWWGEIEDVSRGQILRTPGNMAKGVVAGVHRRARTKWGPYACHIRGGLGEALGKGRAVTSGVGGREKGPCWTPTCFPSAWPHGPHRIRSGNIMQRAAPCSPSPHV